MPDPKQTQHTTLAAALAVAQGEMKNAPFNRTNPHFKSRYADLAAIRDATMPHLSKNGLSLRQIFVIRDSNLVLVTELCHGVSGEKVVSEYPLPTGGTEQQRGSAITYAKRYSWAAMCGISAEEDDDAEAATQTNGNGHKPAAAVGGMGEIPKWRGPLKVVALKTAIKEAEREVKTCTDLNQLVAYLNTKEYLAVVDQGVVDLPTWMHGDGVSPARGLLGLVEDTRKQLASVERA